MSHIITATRTACRKPVLADHFTTRHCTDCTLPTTTAQLWLEISTVVGDEMLDLGTLLGYFCIVACGVCKLPQIQTLYQTRLVGGLSFTSILLELDCHMRQAGFYVSESYPRVEFLEYPLLVIQNFTLLFLTEMVLIVCLILSNTSQASPYSLLLSVEASFPSLLFSWP